MEKPKDSISKKDWVKFVKGYAKANETRTDHQVFVEDTLRQRNWRLN